MTLDSTTSKVQYTQSGTTTAWPVPYKFLDNEDLIVITTVDGVDTALVLDTDYTVTGAGGDAGGTVTISPAVAAGTRVTIYRVVDLDQPTELTTAGGWFPKVHETVFDRLTMQIQQVQEQADRSLRLGVTDTRDPLETVNAIFEARDAASASASAAATSANEAEIAASSVGFISASGTLTAGNDTIVLPFAYNFEAEAVAVYLGGVKQAKDTLTFVDSTHVQVGAAATVDTVWEAVSVVQSGEGVLTAIRDQCLAAQTAAEQAETNAELAEAGAEAARDTVLGALTGYVTKTGTETLTNKTLTGYTETIYALSGTAPALDPDNGTIQTWTLSANSSPTDALAAGQSMTLMVNDGTARSITWPTMNWVGGTAPVLATSGFTVIVLWKIGTTLYGRYAGVA